MSPDLKRIKDRCVEVGKCWIWQQGVNSNGQPNARFGKFSEPVRRKVVEFRQGKRPRAGWFCVALCGQKLCVSPDCAQEMKGPEYVRYLNRIGAINTPAHTAAKTAANRRRSLTKMTMERALELRARINAGEDRGHVAAEFGVSRGHANHIAAGKCWRPGIANASVFDLRP